MDTDRDEWAKVEFDEAFGTRPPVGAAEQRVVRGAVVIADRRVGGQLNSLPKYVVSSTLVDPVWNNSTVLKGGVVDEVSKLKQELDGEIVVYASCQLVRTLIEHDLVDELRPLVFPVVLGAGERLFGETSEKKPSRLVAPGPSATAADLTYELVRQD